MGLARQSDWEACSGIFLAYEDSSPFLTLNLASMSFSADDLVAEIKKHIPEFVCNYKPDPVRQKIADSWPMSIDDTSAQEEWDWKPQFDLKNMTADMIKKLTKKLNIE